MQVIGIDLGTTNSCVAVFEGGRPKVIPYKGTYETIPSMVSVGETGRIIVGHLAKRQAVTNLLNTAYAFKRLIGRSKDSSEVRNLMRLLPYKVIPSPNGDVIVELNGQKFTIPQLSSLILKELKESAEQYLGQPVKQVVITVPAYFADAQRQATKEAGKLAGLDVLRVINEPTAAALAYGIDSEEDKRIAVYDLGGGTFDISILDIGSGVYKVLATGGDSLLGGEDFDQRLMEWVVLQFARETSIDLREDKMALQRIKDAVERAKCELSDVKSTTINLPFIVTSQAGQPLHLNVGISREKLEDLTKDLVERTIRICKETLQDAQISLSSIDEVILVGGQTRMPLVRQKVTEFFGKEPIRSVHPDHVVAMGASIQAHSLVQHDDLLLLDVTSHSLGIKVAGGRFYKLIHKNTTIPTRHKQIFTTVRDYQDLVRIIILQGESNIADENELLGEFTLSDIRRGKKGEVDIEVTFAIDADGIVTVSARDVATNKEQAIKINKPVTYGGENALEHQLNSNHKPFVNYDAHKQNVWQYQNKDNVSMEYHSNPTSHNIDNIFDKSENLKDTKPSLKAFTKENLKDTKQNLHAFDKKPVLKEDRHERETKRTPHSSLNHDNEHVETPQIYEQDDTKRTPSPFSQELFFEDLSLSSNSEDVLSSGSDENPLFSDISSGADVISSDSVGVPFLETEEFGLPLDSFLNENDEEFTPTPELRASHEFILESFTPSSGDNIQHQSPKEEETPDFPPKPDNYLKSQINSMPEGGPKKSPPKHSETRPLFADPMLSELMSLYEEVKKMLESTEEAIKASSYGEDALNNVNQILKETAEKGLVGKYSPQEMEDLISRLKRTKIMLEQVMKLL